jgi:glycosyltransferase involved in cell wall biosynthesis
MRIACISASQVPSTSANSMQVMKACQAISQLGNEAHLFVPSQSQPTKDVDLVAYYGLNSPIQIEWLPDNRKTHHYDLAYQAVRRARRLNVDLTYAWLPQAGIFSLLSGIPVIMELHGPPEGRFGPTLFSLFNRIPGKKRLLPITRALAEQLGKHFNIDINDRNLVQVSPNGVDLERYANLPTPSIARELLGLPPNLTVGYTGHLYPGRGMALLVELARGFPQVNFIWVGGQSADVELWRGRLQAEKIENITLTGFVQNSQLPMYQAAADILLMPYEKVITGSSGGNSATYASPMKMFEYMASKRLIISSDLPVIREVLNPSNAILCPAEDTNSWKQALSFFISNEENRFPIARQAWLDVQQYTWLERARKALAGFVVID